MIFLLNGCFPYYNKAVFPTVGLDKELLIESNDQLCVLPLFMKAPIYNTGSSESEINQCLFYSGVDFKKLKDDLELPSSYGVTFGAAAIIGDINGIEALYIIKNNEVIYGVRPSHDYKSPWIIKKKTLTSTERASILDFLKKGRFYLAESNSFWRLATYKRTFFNFKLSETEEIRLEEYLKEVRIPKVSH